MNCPICSSDNIIKKGTLTLATGVTKQRYKCKDCGEHYSIETDSALEPELFDEVNDFQYERSETWLENNVYSKKRLIITSAQNNTAIDSDFLAAIKTYQRVNDSGFVVIPIKYKTVNSQEDDSINAYDGRLTNYLCENTLNFPNYNVKVYAGLRIQATAENPLSGLDPLSKGWTVIVGHAQVQLRTLPNMDKRIADILTTTGAITEKNYSKTKLGEKAKFNHSLSALVLEFDDTQYHLRHLNYDPHTKSFCDLNKQYFADGRISDIQIEALITGDEHVIFRDSNVENATYSDEDSMISLMKPKYIIRHDVLDSFSISHHHQKNIFTQYAKWQSGMNSIEDELRQTVQYINETTPSSSTTLIVQSNHNEHLLRWLNEVDIRSEPWNAKLYHFLMYQMLEKTEMGPSGTVHPDPFELVARPYLKNNVKFVSRSGMKIMDIQIGAHGDRGINGARGSALGFSKIPDKMVVGHSHSPAIQKGCYVVGTSSKLALEYNTGASTWHHAHVIIHPNGKRQMVFINKDGWRLKNEK
jgi:hypothetical protein